MRILLTGGAGYVGSACLRGLLMVGHDAFAFDDLSTGNAASIPEDRLIVGDINCRQSILDAMKDCQPQAVLHFAALASVPESVSEPDAYWRTNLIGTKNVLDAMRDCGVERILVSSTAAVYSFDAAMPVSEDAPTLPHTPYGTSKLAAERLVADYVRAYGLGAAILRYFNAAGADADGEFGEHRRDESHLIPLALSAALRDRTIRIYGTAWDTSDGTCVRDYVHTEDLMHAHRAALGRLTPGSCAVYNIGTNTGSSVLEVLAICEQVAGRSIRRELSGPRAGDPAVLVADAVRIRRELGWRPRHDIRSIIESAWRWHNRHPEGYRGGAATVT